jgi:O-6-methylguanine DNA methyltransferase
MTLEGALGRLRVPPPDALEGEILAAVGLADRYVERPSALGPLFIAFSENGVSAVSLAGDRERFEERFRAEHGRSVYPTEALPARIGRHLDTAIAEGRPGKMPVDLRGLSEFQVAVLRRAATIPRGEVRPYRWIAREIGNPGAVRAVGSALARNPVPVIIPCHRVVRSDGTFGKYSLGDDANKSRLLEAEGLDVAAYQRLARKGVRFAGSATTRIFCHPTCRAARTITDAHIVEFIDEADALGAGFRPCALCRPVAA